MNADLIFKGILLGWFLSEFTPIQTFLSTYIKPFVKNNYLNTALSCFKCLSFWSTLILSLEPFSAILAALIAYSYEKIMGSFKTYL